MKKRMRTIWVVFGLMLAACGAANGAITVVDVVDSSSGQLDTYFQPSSIPPSEEDSPYYRYAEEDWDWTHSFCPLPRSINYATLEITAWDVDRGTPANGSDGEFNVIYLDGVELGYLDTEL